MKKLVLRLIMVMCMMTVSSTLVNAQIAKPGFQKTERQRMTREQLAQTQARHICNELALDEEKSTKFCNEYCNYMKEFWAIGPKVGKKQRTDMTDAQAETQNKQDFERSQKILDLRQKYYKRYSTFLTQRQIQRVYEIEKQMRYRLAAKKRMNGRMGRK
ncbi:MAG: hypothetical protein MR933_01280 [Prevotella sp.]|uniref:hypothetical protein n=1 Tax=Prevotella sp. TaxID=59823 RepID=UPI0025F0C1BC|nr:hypothetical protein [Prevotella sp.]MCI7118424.1 hypothetical protein [Prevotella sp.]